MKKILTSILVLSIVIGTAQMPAYYNSIDFSQSASIVEANVKSLITSTHNSLTYSNTYPWIKIIDEDQNNSNNVILIYNAQSISKNNTIGGGNTTQPEDWNREHVYPQSMISATAKSDLHHLRACDGAINGARGNRQFVSGSGGYSSVGSTGWYPGDEWKGDVARMIFYVHVRYNEPITDISTLSLLLQWNVADPVSTFEQQRNDLIQNAQGNRNPFIDQPYLATYFWGGADAEDLWGWPNTVEEIKWERTTVFPNPAANTISISSDLNISEVHLLDVSGKIVQTINNVENSSKIDVSNLDAGIYFCQIKSQGDLKNIKFIKQ